MCDVSEGHQFWFSIKGIPHYFICLMIATFFPVSFVCTELMAYTERRKGSVSTGSRRTREVHLEAKCCLMVSSWCTSAQSIRGGSGEHLSWIHRRFVPPQSPCQSNMFWHGTDILPVVPQPPLKTRSSTGLRWMCARQSMHLPVRLYVSTEKQRWQHIYF